MIKDLHCITLYYVKSGIHTYVLTIQGLSHIHCNYTENHGRVLSNNHKLDFTEPKQSLPFVTLCISFHVYHYSFPIPYTQHQLVNALL